jgi:hypothetical protein
MYDYNFLLKQTYSQRELTDQVTRIQNNPLCRREYYGMPRWTDAICTNLLEILDYIYEDFIKTGQDGIIIFCVIYNNIIVRLEDDNDPTQLQSSLSFTYLESQIDMGDLNQIKQTFFSVF